jgi:hypothetical protein
MTEVEYVLSKIKDEVKNMEYDIARGTAKDYAEYQYLCGKLRGLLVAEDIIKALKERMEKDDE